jgi:predicted regulator of Ras-like GTPase activity (Roadblock/LC7/MglB family)
MVERIDGAEAAIIMGLDGIIVERANRAHRADLDVIAAEYTSLLRNSIQTSSDTGLGDLRELLVFTERVTLIVKLLNPDYFVLLALEPDCNLGRARFELRKTQLMLEPEFVV